ncbi:copper chaperone PCu(A)C [Aromatoleum aromaticum]|uniref:copper chaperone PCu(A)C n=1 Tax=Aromatoleum aromaticum TaxID=551760 RepID=UPI001459B729|nr:copper chaperone PCu(A)C [Aromatoleum aromaticum]NMG54058.1 copper chaperone PCu(A)C [Aromatoleum aromaticum]
MKKTLVVSLFSTVLAGPVLAQVQVEDPWVRATVAQQKVTGAFMRLIAAQDARLISVDSPAAGKVEIHEMVMDNDVMKMRRVSAVELPAGQAVELKPGGHHVMLFDLKQPVRVGDTVPLTLVVESGSGKRESIEVAAPVRPLNPAGRGTHGH